MGMRKRRTRDEALVELNGFSPEDREAFADEIKPGHGPP
jgi:hypothetical protein